jgi:pilus assembly protein Flp/PilA
MRRLVLNFCADQAGATAIEYALIASGIALAIIVAVNNVGSTLNGNFAALNTSLK